MNQGAAMAQRSLEIGLVRDQMDAQADALRYMHNAYVANFGENGAATTGIWNEVTAKHDVTEAQAFSDISDSRTCHLAPSGSASSVSSDGAPFAIDIRKLDAGGGSPAIALNQANNIDTTATYAQIRYPSGGSSDPAKPEGIWVQAVRSPAVGGVLGYYDFHIRACWLTPGQSAPVTLGTIVRLYEPKQ
jgi:hypothetical protein